MTKSARIEIRIWTEGVARLPDDLPFAFAPHARHVTEMLEKGLVAGEIVDDKFRGWWEIKS